MVFSLSALWWRRVRGLWKLPDGSERQRRKGKIYPFECRVPKNIQGWFPLGLTGLISLQSKGLSRVFSRHAVWKWEFFSTDKMCPLEKGMANHFSILALRTPWTVWKVRHPACCCSVAKSCPTLCETMNCSTSGFPILHHLPEFAPIHVHKSMMTFNHLILCHSFSFCLQSFPASRSFPMSHIFASGG